MLHLLDESFEAFLRAAVPLSRREVDISFDAPDRDWAARVSRPTINVYLWDIRPNFDQRDAGVELVRGADGAVHRRPPLPRVDCRYVVTAWTSEVRDEHSLLGGTLVALLRHGQLEPVYLKGPIAEVLPLPTIEVAATDDRANSDFWSALGGQLKPGLDVVLTTTVDAHLLTAAGPPVERLTIRTELDRTRVSERTLVGGYAVVAEGTPVTTRRGTGRVGANGAFLVPGDPGDEVTVDGSPGGRIPERGAIDLGTLGPGRADPASGDRNAGGRA